MFVRRVSFALVSTALFAASVAMAGSALASPEEQIATASKAYKALVAGDSSGSIDLYTNAIESRELPPEQLANALMNRALAFQQAKDHPSAIDDYTAALNLDAMSIDLRATALYNRGFSYQKNKNNVRAIEDYTNALMVKPTLSHAFVARGQILRESGQYLFAINDFERALKAEHPDPARVHFALAETYMDLKRPEDARRELAMTLKLKPTHAEAKALLQRLGVAKAAPAMEGDPILTGSVSPVMVDLPKAVEPPAELLQGAEIAPQKSAKIYLDRLPEDSSSTFEEPIMQSANAETDVAMPPVQKAAVVKPKAAELQQAAEAKTEVRVKAKTVVAEKPKDKPKAKIVVAEVESVGDFVADPMETGSISKAEPAKAAWSVQITSAVSENAAWRSWKKISTAKQIADDFKPSVVKADLGAKGIFYRVRLGYDTKDDAANACKKLAAKGVACFVSKG